jgi:HAE1 family hydrophobic/amphiphilic exporter-1
MDINVERVKDAGGNRNDIQHYGYGGLYTTDFNKFGKQYVMIQAKAEDRANLESINNIYVMNNWTKSGDKSVRRFRKNLWS